VERGWWGPAITSGCRLAGSAESGEILLDAAAEAAAPAPLKPRLQPRGGEGSGATFLVGR
jgi:hypothetical protein